MMNAVPHGVLVKALQRLIFMTKSSHTNTPSPDRTTVTLLFTIESLCLYVIYPYSHGSGQRLDLPCP